MRLTTVVGARPQFVKVAALSRAIANLDQADGTAPAIVQRLVDTGQHYDDSLSRIFFEEFSIPAPDTSLHVGSGSHGVQTGKMLCLLEEEFVRTRPDAVLVFGDTNSTLAAALAAAKLCLPVVHVEAGLRSFERAMPEEINRTVTDHLSCHLFCPSQAAAQNLEREGINSGVHVVGDILHDCLQDTLRRVGLSGPVSGAGEYALATVHRPASLERNNLNIILAAFGKLIQGGLRVVLPVHPRTHVALRDYVLPPGLELIEPLSHLGIIELMLNARTVITDSGGLQREAYWLGVPCVTIRKTTEWQETTIGGWNVVTGYDLDAIASAAVRPRPVLPREEDPGRGSAAERIVADLVSALRG